MSFKDIFNDLISQGGMTKEVLLDMLEEIKKRNTPGFIVITEEEYLAIKDRINQLPE